MGNLVEQFWEPRNLALQELCLWEIASLSLWAQKMNRGWRLHWQRELAFFINPRVHHPEKPPEEAKWTSYLTGNEQQIQMRPLLPSRPMVVRPLQTEVLLPRKSVHLFFYVPLHLGIFVGKGRDMVILTELPTVESSKTWFGTSYAGELCYGMEGGIHFEPDHPARGEFHAVVPLKITNSSSQNLAFERLNLKVPQMKLFSTPEMFCTNRVEVVFRGENEESHITFRSNPPEKWKAHQVAPPRVNMGRDMISKSFWFIKNITVN